MVGSYLSWLAGAIAVALIAWFGFFSLDNQGGASGQFEDTDATLASPTRSVVDYAFTTDDSVGAAVLQRIAPAYFGGKTPSRLTLVVEIEGTAQQSFIDEFKVVDADLLSLDKSAAPLVDETDAKQLEKLRTLFDGELDHASFASEPAYFYDDSAKYASKLLLRRLEPETPYWLVFYVHREGDKTSTEEALNELRAGFHVRVQPVD